jgi:D-proline reductase (dithiol) PrdB
MTRTVDSYRFVSVATRRMVQSWLELDSPGDTPWTPLSKPLSDCTIALISTGGIALRTDQPFDQEGERQNPWWGDPSYRVIPCTATAQDIGVYHLHIDPSHAEKDLNCLLPIERLSELANEGVVGRAAPSHYSFMGYLLDPREFLEGSVPAIIRRMRDESVDVVVLVPA